MPGAQVRLSPLARRRLENLRAASGGRSDSSIVSEAIGILWQIACQREPLSQDAQVYIGQQYLVEEGTDG